MRLSAELIGRISADKWPSGYAILKVISAKLSIEHADEIRTKANLSRIPADD